MLIALFIGTAVASFTLGVIFGWAALVAATKDREDER